MRYTHSAYISQRHCVYLVSGLSQWNMWYIMYCLSFDLRYGSCTYMYTTTTMFLASILLCAWLILWSQSCTHVHMWKKPYKMSSVDHIILYRINCIVQSTLRKLHCMVFVRQLTYIWIIDTQLLVLCKVICKKVLFIWITMLYSLIENS